MQFTAIVCGCAGIRKLSSKTLRVMQLTTVLLLGFCLQTAATGISQTITYSGKDVPLEKVFAVIKQQTGYVVSYKASQVRKAGPVTIHGENMPLDQFLNQVLKDEPLTFTIEETTIFIKWKKDFAVPATLNPSSVSPPPPTDAILRGRVTGSNKEPLEGVSVLVKGTQNGTVTDADGRFQLSVASLNNVELVFSFVGFQSKTIKVGSQTVFDVVLEQAVAGLDDIVVVGYGTQRKGSVTGAIATIKNEKISNKPVTSLTQALTGEASGVTVVQRSSKPGAYDEFIRIRGVGTWGDSNPLVLVDGVEQSINSVNPNDVESVTVLKDAAAGAMFGSRAGNGVILINTKRGGGEQPLSVEYSTNLGVQIPTRIPHFNTTYDYYFLTNLGLEARGASPIKNESEMEAFKRGEFDPDRNQANTNWVDAIFRNAGQQSHNIILRGGGKSSYYVSLGYLDQKSIVGNQTWYKRFNTRINTTTRISQRLKVDANVAYMDGIARESVGPYGLGVWDIMQDALRTVPFFPIKYSDGTWSLPPSVHNVVRQATTDDYGHTYNNVSTISGQISPEIKILKELTFKGVVSAEKSFTKYDRLGKIVTYGAFTPDGTSVPSQNAGGGISRNDVANNWSENYRYTLNSTLNFNKSFSKNNFDVLVGTSLESFQNSFTNSRQFDLPSNNLDAISAGTNSPTISGTKTESGIVSFFGRLNYSYDQKYIAEIDFRRDGSSKFGIGHRWGNFPAASLAWNIGEENFFYSLKPTINQLKIRASYGKVGNNRIADYQFLPIFAPNNSTGYSFGDNVISQAYYEASMGNQLITWEDLISMNLGFDFGLLGNKLTGSFDLYNRKTTGILLNLPAPNTLGIAPPVVNAGSVKNSGWELSLRWQDKKGELGYSISGNLSDVKNTVLDLKDYRPVTSSLTIRKEGEPIDAIYGYVSDGIVRPNSPKNELIEPMIKFYGGDPNGSNIVTRRFGEGDIAFKDLNGDKKIDENDKQVIGNQIPRYTYGFDVKASYKNFDLSLFFQGVGKVDGYLLYEARSALFKVNNVYYSGNTNAKYPRPGSYERMADYNSFWVEDASYLRLKNVQIGYNFGNKIKRIIKDLRIYLTGENVFTLTKFSGFDPESRVGMRGWGFPMTKNFSLGINVKF